MVCSLADMRGSGGHDFPAGRRSRRNGTKIHAH
jgi:hypothetical protein